MAIMPTGIFVSDVYSILRLYRVTNEGTISKKRVTVRRRNVIQTHQETTNKKYNCNAKWSITRCRASRKTLGAVHRNLGFRRHL